ncbi:hypothetical protein [Paenibacillus sp. FSL H8-0537]
MELDNHRRYFFSSVRMIWDMEISQRIKSGLPKVHLIVESVFQSIEAAR